MKLVKRKLNVVCLNVLSLMIFASGYSVADPTKGSCMLVGTTYPAAVTPTYVGPGNSAKVSLNRGIFDITSTPDTPSGACDNANSQITLPPWARWVKVTGHVGFPPQSVGSGHLSIHLFRNVHGATSLTSVPALTSYGMNYATQLGTGDHFTPEAYYHNSMYYPNESTLTGSTGGRNYSILATTDWIPVFAVGETWTLYAAQDATCTVGAGSNPCTGPSVLLPAGAEQWLKAEFSDSYLN